IRARNTSLDGPTNGSAGINSAPNVDAGINGATHLGGRRCGDHEGRGDSTDYRKLAGHEIGPKERRSWRRRTNVWRKVTILERQANRLTSETTRPHVHGSQRPVHRVRDQQWERDDLVLQPERPVLRLSWLVDRPSLQLQQEV